MCHFLQFYLGELLKIKIPFFEMSYQYRYTAMSK
jgi:hypothetical protein